MEASSGTRLGLAVGLVLLCALGLFIAGCMQAPSPGQPQPSPAEAYARARPLVQSAVTIAVHSVLRRHPQLAPTVQRVAQDAAAAIAGPLEVTTLLPLLDEALRQLPLSQADIWLVQDLTAAVVVGVQAVLAATRLEVRLEHHLVSEVLGMIAAAATGPLARAR